MTDSEDFSSLGRFLFLDDMSVFIGYSFEDNKFTKDETIRILKSRCHACFADYTAVWEKSYEENKKIIYNILIYMPTILVDSVKKVFNEMFTHITIEEVFRRDLYTYQALYATYKYCKEDIDFLEQRVENEGILKNLALFKETIKPSNSKECLVNFRITMSDEYSISSQYYLYYLLGVMLRTLALSERKYDQIVNDSNPEVCIKNAFKAGFAGYSHWVICEKAYPPRILLQINNIKGVNSKFDMESDMYSSRFSNKKFIRRPMQTIVCTKLYELDSEENLGKEVKE